MKAILVILLLATIGCGIHATFGEIRQTEPVKTLFISDQTPKNFANCSLYELQNNFAVTIAEKDSSCFIMIQSARGFGVSVNFGELSFKPKDHGTLVELRTSNYASAWKARIWDCVVKCASPQNSPGNQTGLK